MKFFFLIAPFPDCCLHLRFYIMIMMPILPGVKANVALVYTLNDNTINDNTIKKKKGKKKNP